MKNLKIFHRMLLTLLLAVIGTGTVAGGWLWSTHETLMTDRQDKTRNLVEAAQTLLASYHSAEQEGRLSREEAQRQATDALRRIRYGTNDYFWVNDLDARIVMHPIKPELDGKDLSDFRDPSGKRIFSEFAATARRDGAGFVPYLWSKPGHEEPVDKLSYVSLFAPWGWVVGTGIYIDDVDAIFQRTALVAAATTAATILAITLAIFVIARGITRPIRAMTTTMTALASGNLDVDVPATDRRDEIGAMASAVGVFKNNALEMRRMQSEQEQAEQRVETEKRAAMSKLATHFEASVGSVVRAVGDTSAEMRGSAEAMSSVASRTSSQSEVVAGAADRASVNVQTVATAAEQLSSSIAEISRQVSQAAQITGVAVADASRANETVAGLTDAAEKIGAVVRLISDIAAQTNLLALNATIEAARAGDAGKGFSVVASEVKALASQTTKATEEIASGIGGIQAATREAVDAIGGIGTTIGHINEIASAIAAAVEQQGAATEEIVRNAEQAARGTEDVSSTIQDVTRAAAETGDVSGRVLTAAADLARQAEMLHGEVERFITSIGQAA